MIKLQAYVPATLLKEDWQSCFPVNFAKFLRTPFVTEQLWTTASEPNSMKDLLWKPVK